MLRKLAIGILLIASHISCNAQELFYSQKDKALFAALHDVCKTDSILINNHLFSCTEVVKEDTVNIVICKDENDIIEHIGCKFIPDSTYTNNRLITKFIERELLSLLLSNNIEETMKINNDNYFFILLNDNEIPIDSLADRKWFFNLWKNNRGMVIDRENKNYMVTILCPNNQNLSFIFQADVALISGMYKKEHDKKLAIQLSNYYSEKFDEIGSAVDCDLLQYYMNDSINNDSIFVIKGESYTIPQINSDLYYWKNDSVYTPVCDSSHIAMSFSNAILMPDLNNYDVEIRHCMYGYKKHIYTMTSKEFFSFFSKDFEMFFGIETLDKDNLTGTLILYNQEADYIHMLYISTTMNDLMNNGKIYMNLYSNIPQHDNATPPLKY